jgi:enoyl-[acyl-carrier protein] reductase/trans-2-enoyl-CoA reductase (NAD+)
VAVTELWKIASNDNFKDISDYEGYRSDFLKLFGFGLEGVDYEAETDPEIDFEN